MTMPPMHPETELMPFVRGELSAEERRRVQHHLDDCASCRDEMGALAATLQHVASRLEELPTPEWTAYRRDMRLRLANRSEKNAARARWWRPSLLWPSLATAGVGIAALIFALTMHPTPHPGAPGGVDILAMEQQSAEPVDVGLLRDYPVVEKLDLLEDYDVIEHLDEMPPADHHDDKRS
jgi:anti-sigma factor RsiW